MKQIFWAVEPAESEYEPNEIDLWACLACFLIGVLIGAAWIIVSTACW